MLQIKQPPGSSDGISVQELLALLPGELIEQLAEELNVDKWIKKLKADFLFKLVLYSILNSERLSLRILEDNFQDPLFRVLAPAIAADEVTWTGIRERLMKVNSLFFRKLYEAVYQRAAKLYGVSGLKGYHIKRYDSTMIATFSYLLEGMKVGNTKKGKTQVKLTTEFKDDFLIQMHFHQDQAHLSEEKALKEAIQSSEHTQNDIQVFDKGLKSRKSFERFDTDDILFLTRVQERPRYDLLHPHWQDDGYSDTKDLEFIQDSAVYLYKDGGQVCKRKFRLIQYRVKKNGKTLSFLTNVWDLPAQTIAEIYRMRWDIEVLFRFMKQEMNLTHFVCNDLNAIQVMLYCTMIASMLILIYKKRNSITSYKKAKIQFFKELLYTIILDAIEDPEGLEWFKNNLKTYAKRE